MPDFGMPTLLETELFGDAAALAEALGLQFVELNMNLPAYQPDAFDARQLRASADRHGVYCTMHLDENLNPFDFNPLVAEAYRETVRRAIQAARALDCPVFNMHLSRGVYFTLPERRVFLFERYRAQYLDSVRRFRDACTEEIGSAGVHICIENTDGYPAFQAEALELLLESPVFGLTFDVGHSHAAGDVDEAFLLAHAGRLSHMHLHDAAGKRCHLVLGSGELDLFRYLRLASQHACRVVLETKTVDGLRASVDWLRGKAGEFLLSFNSRLLCP